MCFQERIETMLQNVLLSDRLYILLLYNFILTSLHRKRGDEKISYFQKPGRTLSIYKKVPDQALFTAAVGPENE